jgi:hypothetical protein
MTHTSFNLVVRLRASVWHWFKERIQECVRCTGCDGAVFPFVSYCPTCGQANPTQVSTSAAICLVLGFLVLAIAAAILTTMF